MHSLQMPGPGRIDIITSDLFESGVKSAAAATDRDVIVDGSDVTYLSSAGLRAFLSLWQDLNKRGRNLYVCALKPYIREVFHIIGFDQLIPIYADVASALNAVGSQIRRQS